MTDLFKIDGERFLKVRISVRMLKCNFSCSYCVAAAGQSQVSGTDYSQGAKRNMWGTKEGRDTTRKAVEWVASLPYRVGVRYDVHGEPFLNPDVIEDLVWLTGQPNVAFVEVQTNGSLFKKRLPQFIDRIDVSKLKLFCTFHHTEIGLDEYLANVVFASDLGFEVTVNTLLATDNVAVIREILARCRERGIETSADLKFPGFDVPATEAMSDTVDVDKKARHFLNKDPFDELLNAGDAGLEVFRTVADSGPLGKEFRFLAALLVGLYGGTGRECSAGHDYIVVDNWGDVFPCSNYADTNTNRLGSVMDPGFVPKLRETPYAPCQYRETCHQKEEYGNLKILREHRDLNKMTLNCRCGQGKDVDTKQLFDDRMALIELARQNLPAVIGKKSVLPRPVEA
jgi:sulfatase maturation enzyme AslB (radical SAM superfamily)